VSQTPTQQQAPSSSSSSSLLKGCQPSQQPAALPLTRSSSQNPCTLRVYWQPQTAASPPPPPSATLGCLVREASIGCEILAAVQGKGFQVLRSADAPALEPRLQCLLRLHLLFLSASTAADPQRSSFTEIPSCRTCTAGNSTPQNSASRALSADDSSGTSSASSNLGSSRLPDCEETSCYQHEPHLTAGEAGNDAGLGQLQAWQADVLRVLAALRSCPVSPAASDVISLVPTMRGTAVPAGPSRRPATAAGMAASPACAASWSRCQQ